MNCLILLLLLCCNSNQRSGCGGNGTNGNGCGGNGNGNCGGNNTSNCGGSTIQPRFEGRSFVPFNGQDGCCEENTNNGCGCGQ